MSNSIRSTFTPTDDYVALEEFELVVRNDNNKIRAWLYKDSQTVVITLVNKANRELVILEGPIMDMSFVFTIMTFINGTNDMAEL